MFIILCNWLCFHLESMAVVWTGLKTYHRKRTVPPKPTKLCRTRGWFPKVNIEFWNSARKFYTCRRVFVEKEDSSTNFQLASNAEKNTVIYCYWKEKHLIFNYVFAVKNVTKSKKINLHQQKIWRRNHFYTYTFMRMVSLLTENVSQRKSLRFFLPAEDLAYSGKPLANPPAIEGRKLGHWESIWGKVFYIVR